MPEWCLWVIRMANDKTGMEFPSEAAWKAYKEKHPGAEKKDHTIKHDSGGSSVTKSDLDRIDREIGQSKRTLEPLVKKLRGKNKTKLQGFLDKVEKGDDGAYQDLRVWYHDVYDAGIKTDAEGDLLSALGAAAGYAKDLVGRNEKQNEWDSGFKQKGASMSDLRMAVIKLAKRNPELRKHLVPILREAAAPKYDAYVKKKREEGKKPLSKDEWERKVLNTGKSGDEYEVEEFEKELQKTYRQMEREDREKEKGKGKEKPGGKKEDVPKGDKKTPAKSYKKKYHAQVTKVMDKHNLTDTDADEVKAFKKDKPKSKTKVPPAELLRRFLAKAKPETKERMKGVSPAEFISMLGAILQDEEGAGT